MTKKDLDYETLYALAIKENKIDDMIAELFDITKEQVRYLRKKQNLSNKFLKRMVDFSEPFLQKCPEAKDTYYEDLKNLQPEKKIGIFKISI